MRLRWKLLGIAAANAVAVAFVACGARTGLDVPDVVPADAGPDAMADAPKDSPADTPIDVPEDVPNDCADPSTTYIYVVTAEENLYAFHPADGVIEPVGPVACDDASSTPFSMAVDRKGRAYVLYSDGELFRVSTKDASCKSTAFMPTPTSSDFHNFGMGFALDSANGPNETLYVADIKFTVPSAGLASIDTNTFALTPIGPFSDNPSDELEMTSAPDGNLYGCFLDANVGSGWIVDIDKTNATILSETKIPLMASTGSALAFAAWGGDFFTFTTGATPGTTEIHRYHPEDGSITNAGSLSETVVGAGVSTCAPTQ